MPVFSFVQINDTHVQSPEGKASDQPRLPKAEEKLAAVVKAINDETHFPLPAFVLGLGDLGNGGRLDLLEPDLRVFENLVRPLRCPFLPAVGNHENVQREGNPEYEAAYGSVFGPGRKNYLFTCGGVLFVVVNNSGARGGGDTVSGARNAWLREVLVRHADVPKIIVCHVPLVSFRDADVLRESFGFETFRTSGTELLDLVDAHTATVIAVLNGHLHLTGVVERNEVYHICPSGPSSYPSHFAHLAVFQDHVDVTMHQPPEALVGERSVNNLHGTPRWEKEYTDADHPTPEAYVAGLPEEHRFFIDLPQQKRPRPGVLGEELRVPHADR